ncbi:MAG: HAD family hydrolase [Candidatus Angelobacter sp. Gp1-AA117]|nr:MAG: HAD family hydrolase [Candidatus Angelobacter sp. Gp1-AA117]
MILTCKAILFDLDGVLVDSTAAVERVWRLWALERNLDPEPVIEHAHGRRSIETVRRFAPELDAGQENLAVENMEIADREGVIPLPGSSEMLRKLPQDKFAIVTSATRALAEARLSYAGLPLPQHLVSADDVIHGKPSPEPYLKGASMLGFAAQDCLVFEDTPAGVLAARSGGMKAIALITTYSASELKSADAIAGSLAEMKLEFSRQDIRVIIECAVPK